MSLPDPIAALVEYLAADAVVAALVTGRVYGESIPRDQASAMPRAAVLLTPAGGSGLRSFSKFFYQVVDVRTYGATAIEAEQLQLACLDALRGLERSVHQTAVLYRAAMQSGVFPLLDTEAGWPGRFSTWEVATTLTGVS